MLFGTVFRDSVTYVELHYALACITMKVRSYIRGMWWPKLRSLHSFLWQVTCEKCKIYDMLSTLELHMHCDCLKNFEEWTFVDNKLLVKTAKITSLENLYAYSIKVILLVQSIAIQFFCHCRLCGWRWTSLTWRWCIVRLGRVALVVWSPATSCTAKGISRMLTISI